MMHKITLKKIGELNKINLTEFMASTETEIVKIGKKIGYSPFSLMDNFFTMKLVSLERYRVKMIGCRC